MLPRTIQGYGELTGEVGGSRGGGTGLPGSPGTTGAKLAEKPHGKSSHSTEETLSHTPLVPTVLAQGQRGSAEGSLFTGLLFQREVPFP